MGPARGDSDYSTSQGTKTLMTIQTSFYKVQLLMISMVALEKVILRRQEVLESQVALNLK